MSNIPNGGRIIIGVSDNLGVYTVTGMEDSHFQSFNQDVVCDHVGKYAEPFVTVQVQKVYEGEQRFVVMTVEEFEEKPVICKKNYTITTAKGEEFLLRNGDIYTRTIGTKPQSTKISSYSDLREIIDMAVRKGVKVFLMNAKQAGLSAEFTTVRSDEDRFNEQLKDFL